MQKSEFTDFIRHIKQLHPDWKPTPEIWQAIWRYARWVKLANAKLFADAERAESKYPKEFNIAGWLDRGIRSEAESRAGDASCGIVYPEVDVETARRFTLEVGGVPGKRIRTKKTTQTPEESDLPP